MERKSPAFVPQRDLVRKEILQQKGCLCTAIIQEAVEVTPKDLLARSAPNIVVELSVVWFLVWFCFCFFVAVASLTLELHPPFPHICLAVLL